MCVLCHAIFGYPAVANLFFSFPNVKTPTNTDNRCNLRSVHYAFRIGKRDCWSSVNGAIKAKGLRIQTSNNMWSQIITLCKFKITSCLSFFFVHSCLLILQSMFFTSKNLCDLFRLRRDIHTDSSSTAAFFRFIPCCSWNCVNCVYTQFAL